MGRSPQPRPCSQCLAAVRQRRARALDLEARRVSRSLSSADCVPSAARLHEHASFSHKAPQKHTINRRGRPPNFATPGRSPTLPRSRTQTLGIERCLPEGGAVPHFARRSSPASNLNNAPTLDTPLPRIFRPLRASSRRAPWYKTPCKRWNCRGNNNHLELSALAARVNIEDTRTRGMSTLEDLQPSASVRGILPDALVTVVSVQWYGSSAVELP